jgi:PHD/YefM family antitoxin component YafN of YafNO toxin-antitoxin module
MVRRAPLPLAPPNTLTVAELKRRGLATIQEALLRGPVHILKRNRPAAVILSEADYETILSARRPPIASGTALRWLLQELITGIRSKADLDAELQANRDW